MKKNILCIILLIVFCLSSPTYAQDKITIKEYLQQALPPQEGRKIILDSTAGLLTITDTFSNHRLIKELIEAFDIGIPQVMVEAKFVEVTMTDISELGVEWYWYESGVTGNAPEFSSYSTSEQTNVDGITWGIKDKAGNYQSFPQQGHGMDFYIGRTTTSGNYLYAYLHALEEAGKANLLSAPRVTTLSGQMANMQTTTTFPYVSKVELENEGTAEHPIWVLKQTIDERSIGITLEVTPRVSAGSEYITMDLHPVVDVLLAKRSIKPSTTSTYSWTESAGGSTTEYTTTVSVPGVPSAVGWPVIDTRSIQTSVISHSGQTIVLGGLIKENEAVIERKIPLLGDIPLLGNLFRYKHINKEKKSLLIFITATLITPRGENK